jgi:phosphoglycerol transferase MdoB-like AlkP superfamily enzyme
MKYTLRNLVLHYLFWLIFFALGRLFFLVYYAGYISQQNISIGEVLLAFPSGLRLDTATFCYPGFIMLLFITLYSTFGGRLFRFLLQGFNYLLLTGYSLIIVGEAGIYEEWQTKLNFKALRYLAHPSEVINSAQTHNLIFLSIMFLLLLAAGLWLYYKLVSEKMRTGEGVWWKDLLVLIVMLPILVVGARGGIQQIPINQSQSYYSKHEILNHAAVNSAFNLYISWFENRQFKEKNPFVFMPSEEARAIVDTLFAKPAAPPVEILTTQRPNIVMLILESWSADLIESLGGEPGITPEFRKLEKEGILFTQAYAGGKRSEQGIAAIFSAFPPHPYTSITVQPDKYRHLPSIVHKINALGYHSSFYFGGQLIYGNIKSYIIFNKFHRIKEIYDFKLPRKEGKLGIHDEYTLNELIHDLKTEPQPFFSALFTLSSHSPYDQPMEEKLPWGDNERKYINSAYYTDWSLGRFFEQARKQPWYSNTLFILVADHSHNSYRNWHPNSFEYNRIPILFYGDVIKPEWKGKQLDRLVSQTDVGTTLLKLLGQSTDGFFWGRDMFNPQTPNFTYLTFDYGVGWKIPEGEYIWDHKLQIPFRMTIPAGKHLIHEKHAKAFLQALFQEYLDY